MEQRRRRQVGLGRFRFQQDKDNEIGHALFVGEVGEPRQAIGVHRGFDDVVTTRAQKVLFVKADDGIPWQDVATVIDEAHSAGVDTVALITAKIEAAG